MLGLDPEIQPVSGEHSFCYQHYSGRLPNMLIRYPNQTVFLIFSDLLPESANLRKIQVTRKTTNIHFISKVSGAKSL
jgi:hypothetical protein